MRPYTMPAEWFRHERTWMVWPYRPDNWKQSAKPAQKAYLNVALAIAEFEQLSLCVPGDQMQLARSTLEDLVASHEGERDEQTTQSAKNIEFVQIESDDAWVRDTGPTFVHNQRQQLVGLDWQFNAWGEIYKPYDKDAVVARNICNYVRIESEKVDFVLEGGSFHVDGEGTILTTEECLLHLNRNPHLSKEDIEQRLLHYLGGDKVIWLPDGLVGDEDTNGHIDNFCCFARPGEVLLAWTDDPLDAQYARSLRAYEILSSVKDARDRALKITKVPIPSPMYYTKEDTESLLPLSEGEEVPRFAGERLAGSYINFYVCNGGVIVPQFGVPEDREAVRILSEVYSDYKIKPVHSRDILLGGGNIHCITQQQPVRIEIV